MSGANVLQQTEMTGHVRRRLSDRIEDAFDQACRQGQADVAACLLNGLDLCLLGRPTTWDRRQAAMSLLRNCADRLEKLRLDEAAGAMASGASASGLWHGLSPASLEVST